MSRHTLHEQWSFIAFGHENRLPMEHPEPLVWDREELYILSWATSSPSAPNDVTVGLHTVISPRIALLMLATALAAGCSSAAPPPPVPTPSIVPAATSSSPTPLQSPTPTPTPAVAPVAPPPTPATQPATTSPAAPPPAASCYPLSNEGTCYEPGEYCRDDDHGASGVAGDGKQITCEDNDGWRWEPV
jgi:hypothetical protein